MVTENQVKDKYIELKILYCAAQSGDQQSYKKFLQGVSTLLRRIIARKLAHSEVEDVLQEVLISIHKALPSYDGKRPIMPWLMAITKFRINDYLRKIYANNRFQMLDIDDLAEELEDVTISYQSNESIDSLLENVSERDKQILSLMHVEGYTAKETGQHLGMQESAVKVAAHRALKKIRERVDL